MAKDGKVAKLIAALQKKHLTHQEMCDASGAKMGTVTTFKYYLLSHGFNMVYTRSFLRTMKSKSLDKLQQFPRLFDREKMLHARDLYEFDSIVTAPLHGFRDADDYWHRASAKLVMNDITVPTLVLNAKNDPFLPPQHLPPKAASSVTLDYPEQGGHVGFAIGGPPGRLDWLPRHMLRFLSET